MNATAAQPAAEADDQPACGHVQPCACRAKAPAGESVRTVRLSDLRRGQTGTICECELGGEDAALLRAMGLCTAARVRLCREGEPCIVAIQCGRRSARRIVEDATRRRTGHVDGATWSGSRIGLARKLAERIAVAPDQPPGDGPMGDK